MSRLLGRLQRRVAAGGGRSRFLGRRAYRRDDGGFRGGLECRLLALKAVEVVDVLDRHRFGCGHSGPSVLIRRRIASAWPDVPGGGPSCSGASGTGAAEVVGLAKILPHSALRFVTRM